TTSNLPKAPYDGSERLRGAAAWAAYVAVEALLAVLLRGASSSLPPDNRYTLVLLILYPLIGALLGRFAVVGLAIAFAANAIAVIPGAALAVPLVSVVIAVAIFRKRPWAASLLLLAPMWAAREIGASSTFRVKALL